MPALPADFPLQAYVGHTVALVTEVPNQVEIKLDALHQRAWIHFEGPGVLHRPNGEIFEFGNQTLHVGSGAFQDLIGAKVDRVARRQDDSCMFEFSNGYSLSLLAGPSGYESYHLGVANDFCDV